MEELTGRFRAREAAVGVIGLGYVGLPLALWISDDARRLPVKLQAGVGVGSRDPVLKSAAGSAGR